MTPEERVEEGWVMLKQAYPATGEKGSRRRRERMKNAYVEEAARAWGLPMGEVRRIIERRRR